MLLENYLNLNDLSCSHFWDLVLVGTCRADAATKSNLTALGHGIPSHGTRYPTSAITLDSNTDCARICEFWSRGAGAVGSPRVAGRGLGGVLDGGVTGGVNRGS